MKKQILTSIESLELMGITFIRDYIQFLFDGPILNTYTLPQVKTQNKVIISTDLGYYDTLCTLIGKKITSADENKAEEKITLKFKNDIELFLSLKSEDRNCTEAVMLQLKTDGEWETW